MTFLEKRRKRKPLTKDQMLGIANYLTYARIAMVPVVVLLMMAMLPVIPERMPVIRTLGWVSMIVFVLAQLSDVVDGYYARKYNVTSSFGKFIDPLADKLMSLSVLIMLIPLGRIQGWMVVLLMIREVTITTLRTLAVAEDLELAASGWGKRKTLIQSFALGFLLVYEPLGKFNVTFVGVGLLWITLLVSYGSGIQYVVQFFSEVLEKEKQEGDES